MEEASAAVAVDVVAASVAEKTSSSDIKPSGTADIAPAKTDVANDEPKPEQVVAKTGTPDAQPSKAEVEKAELAKADPPKVEAPPVLKIAELRPAVISDAPRIVPERQLRSGPVSVFVSRKEKRLYVRKGFEPIFETSVEIADADRPLGTHVFTAMALGEDGAQARWSVVTMPPERAKAKRAEPERRGKRAERTRIAEVAVADTPPPVTSASEALDRVSMPKGAVDRISELMSVGASLVISDQGLGPETGLETDFVVLTR
jgi:hypothetical protein